LHALCDASEALSDRFDELSLLGQERVILTVLQAEDL
jgi:hypothetical protein